MSIPGFNAELSLGALERSYRESAVPDRTGDVRVLPMLDDICGNCEIVGGFGTIKGVGIKSCCRKVFAYDPITKRYTQTWSCWFERCTPERVVNPWFTF